jgi:ADP-Ribosyltransferase in polyvalent proteins
LNEANWFSKTPKTAEIYAGKQGYIIPAHIQLTNPLNLNFDMNGSPAPALKLAKKMNIDIPVDEGDKAYHVINNPKFIEAAKQHGFDGLSVNEGGEKTFAVFNPNKIKSTIANRGTFDTTQQEITKAQGGAV